MREIDQLISNRKDAMDKMRAMVTGKVLEGEDLKNFNSLKEEVTNYNEQIAALQDLNAIELATGNFKEHETKDEIKTFIDGYVRKGDVTNIATTASGGYLVPTKLHDKIVEKIDAESIIMQLAEVIPVSGPLDIVAENAAVTSYWTAEGGQTTVSDPTFSKIQMQPKKLTTLVKITEEALEDSAFDLEKYLITHVARKNAEEIDKQAIIGTQSDALEGVITTVSVVTASATNSISYTDIVKLYSAAGNYRKNGCWIVSTDALTQIMLLQDGAGHYIYTAPRENVPDLLLGKPLYVSDDMDSVLTAKKPVLFGDMSYYKVANRKGLTVQRLTEKYAGEGAIGFRFVQRLDGKLTVKDAVNALKMA